MWLLVPFLPSSHMFISIGTMIAERLLYLPSIGFCLLVGYVLGWFSSTCFPPHSKTPNQQQQQNNDQLDLFFGGASELPGTEVPSATRTKPEGTATGKDARSAKPEKKLPPSTPSKSTGLTLWLVQLAIGVLITSFYFNLLILRNEDWMSDRGEFPTPPNFLVFDYSNLFFFVDSTL